MEEGISQSERINLGGCLAVLLRISAKETMPKTITEDNEETGKYPDLPVDTSFEGYSKSLHPVPDGDPGDTKYIGRL